VAKFGFDPFGDLCVKRGRWRKCEGEWKKKLGRFGTKVRRILEECKGPSCSSKFYFGSSVACFVNSRLNRDVAVKRPEHQVSRFREGNPPTFWTLTDTTPDSGLTYTYYVIGLWVIIIRGDCTAKFLISGHGDKMRVRPPNSCGFSTIWIIFL